MRDMQLCSRRDTFIYPIGVDPVNPVLIGYRRDREYVVRGQPTLGGIGWITGSGSETNRDREALR